MDAQDRVFGAAVEPCLAGYDSGKTRDLLTELGCAGVISIKGFPLQVGKRWVVERTNSWHNRSFKMLAICTERRTRVIEASIALANAVIIHPTPHPPGLDHPHRWDTRPADAHDLSAEPLS